jgi:hypothetical protein
LLSAVRFPKSFFAASAIAASVFIVSMSSATAQTAGDAPPPAPANATSSVLADALGSLQPTMTSVNSALASVDVHRWKVPGDVKDQTASDIQSIQRDIDGSLPGLISQAQASPSAVGPSFAVFRNIDALYDVLLRVTETATLAGSEQEANHLESARADLQTRRRQLGDALLSSATAQDATVTQLRASLDAARQSANPAATAGPKKVVVDDGPAGATKPAHKKKVVKPSTPAAAPATPQQ